MTNHFPTVAIVICTRDRPDDLELCLHSIEGQSVRPDQVIIVSGSDRSLSSDIRKRFGALPITTVDCHEDNISKSRNIGLDAATCEIILFIDDDAVAHDGWVRSYVNIFKANPEVWAVGGDVYDSRCGAEKVEFSRGLISPYGLQIPVREGAESGLPRGYLLNVKGCNFAVRRREIVRLGGFDPFYIFSFEESDLMMTIHASGGLVVHERAAKVDHSHAYGLYRRDGWMNRNWRVEYASHTMFMLKHTPKNKRIFGRLLVRRRFFKLGYKAMINAVCGGMKVRDGIKIIRDAHQGINEAHKAFADRNHPHPHSGDPSTGKAS